ncbi:hypothetical protein M3697_14815 [Janibacter melonis]|uniref:hypothetical protein n=1 Tax=Janibacter melonis TaxID=262209 RepID=UPI002043F4C4|nr:hypothetical protein [Janibacter melonis]MCM3556360.1 hypothetical protein [Janibacter melonis]
MNELGRIAMNHWERWRPEQVEQMSDPTAHFTRIGEQAQEQMAHLAEEMLRREPAREDYLQEIARRRTAEATARELILAELLPTPQDPQSPASRSPVDPTGMPTDPSHPLWGDLEDDEVSPSEFQRRRETWIRSLQSH